MDVLWVVAYCFDFGPDAFRDIQDSTSWRTSSLYWFILIGGGFIAVWTGVSAIDKYRARREKR